MEARADREGLKSGALGTVEAMIVSMGFMAPSVAMFFNTPFIAQFAGAAMPLAMLFSFAAVFLVALGFSQLAQRTASAGNVYAFVSNAINPKTGFMGMWLFIIGYGIFEAATYSIFAAFSSEELNRIFGLSVPWFIPFFAIAGLLYPVPDPPYNLWPYLLAAWVLIGLVILFVISRRRPELIEALGAAFSEAGVDEPDTAQEDVRRREDRGAAPSKETTE